jgi:hypothetical protein
LNGNNFIDALHFSESTVSNIPSFINANRSSELNILAISDSLTVLPIKNSRIKIFWAVSSFNLYSVDGSPKMDVSIPFRVAVLREFFSRTSLRWRSCVIFSSLKTEIA